MPVQIFIHPVRNQRETDATEMGKDSFSRINLSSFIN